MSPEPSRTTTEGGTSNAPGKKRHVRCLAGKCVLPSRTSKEPFSTRSDRPWPVRTSELASRSRIRREILGSDSAIQNAQRSRYIADRVSVMPGSSPCAASFTYKILIIQGLVIELTAKCPSGTSKDQLRTMWEAGQPLNSTWAEFAVLFDRAAQIPVSTHPTKGIRFFADDQNTGELHAPRNPKTARQTRGTRSRERSHMSAQICAGRLWAIGMRIVSTGADELVRIPSGHFRLDKKKVHKVPSFVPVSNGTRVSYLPVTYGIQKFGSSQVRVVATRASNHRSRTPQMFDTAQLQLSVGRPSDQRQLKAGPVRAAISVQLPVDSGRPI